jgi:glutamine amidotransferase
MSSTIAVVDYGMGNLRSVSKALEHVVQDTQRVIVSSDARDIADAEHVVFPGQGAARDCIKQLNDLNLVDAVKQAAEEKPFLGICMGMQVLMAHSEENNGIECMNFYAGDVRSFADKALQQQMQSLKIPHMGWNSVSQQQDHPLWYNIQNNSRFYFVHSYYVDPDKKSLTAGSTEYGIDFVSVIAKNNVFAAQFHPEKSAHDGLQLLNNFCRWDGRL